MSDLVKRLREDQPVTQDMESTIQCALQDEAADRIEELEAENANLKNKLAKAVEWFDEIRQHCANFGRGVPSIDERIIERCEETAAIAIAELKGGSNE